MRSIRVSHIVLTTEDLADLVYDSLKDIDDRPLLFKTFANMARKYSACGSRDKGGDLGMLEFNTAAKEMEVAAMKAPVGIVQPPVQTKFGYHVFVVTEEEALGDTGIDGLNSSSLR